MGQDAIEVAVEISTLRLDRVYFALKDRGERSVQESPYS